MSSKIVSVLGCGWLGMPLARNLISLGYAVKGSTTSKDKFKELSKDGIVPYEFSIYPPRKTDFQDFFEADILFLNIPFRRDLEAPSYYLEQVNEVVQAAKGSPVQTVIFAGSTSIYPEDCGTADEETVIAPVDPRSVVLMAVEELLQSVQGFETVILRFAGLYGEERKIGKFLAGKKDVPDPDSPVNLVHLEDCTAVITEIIQRGITGELLNVCSDSHPTRRELYTKAAEEMNLPAPQFSAEPSRKTKVVSNTKLKELLGYTFIHPDPMDLFSSM